MWRKKFVPPDSPKMPTSKARGNHGIKPVSAARDPSGHP